MPTAEQILAAEIVADRRDFIAKNLDGVHKAYHSHIGNDPAKWEQEAKDAREKVTADVKSHMAEQAKEKAAADAAKPPGRWDWVKMHTPAVKPDVPGSKWNHIKMPA